jgi:hypothetical protein
MNNLAGVWELNQGLSESEVQQEGRRMLRALAKPGLFLAPQIDGGYGLAGSKRAGRVMKLAAVLVAEFRRRDWLKPRGTTPETFALGDAGAGWLARGGVAAEPFAVQHQIRVERRVKTQDGEHAVVVNEAESPLAWMRARGMLSVAQFQAGDRLRCDFTLAHLMPRLCADLSAPISHARGGAKAAPQAENVIAAKQRFRLAMSSVGPGLSDLLFEVCCHLRGLESIESANAWPNRSAKVVLQIGLDRLAAHYGIAPHTKARGKMRAWRAQDSGSVSLAL